MDLSEFQREATSRAFHPGHGDKSWTSVAYAALGAAEEAGEVAGKVKKVHREDGGDFTNRRDAILSEVGDTLWYLQQICTELDADFGDVAQGVLDKIDARASRGTLEGDGDNR